MDYDPMLAAMLSQPWSNNACRGYVIYAMENCGFSPNDIRRVVAELYEVFDFCSLEEAQQHFEESPYCCLLYTSQHTGNDTYRCPLLFTEQLFGT